MANIISKKSLNRHVIKRSSFSNKRRYHYILNVKQESWWSFVSSFGIIAIFRESDRFGTITVPGYVTKKKFVDNVYSFMEEFLWQ